ncbi:1009_t:CDS:2, partial [Dentiscutata erythropus]
SDALEYAFKLNNEVLGLILPVTILTEYYWVEHVKNTIAFLMDADNNKRCEFHAEINEGEMEKDYEYKILEYEINPFSGLPYKQYKSRILQITQRINRDLVPSTNISADDITHKQKQLFSV